MRKTTLCLATLATLFLAGNQALVVPAVSAVKMHGASAVSGLHPLSESLQKHRKSQVSEYWTANSGFPVSGYNADDVCAKNYEALVETAASAFHEVGPGGGDFENYFAARIFDGVGAAKDAHHTIPPLMAMPQGLVGQGHSAVNTRLQQIVQRCDIQWVSFGEGGNGRLGLLFQMKEANGTPSSGGAYPYGGTSSNGNLNLYPDLSQMPGGQHVSSRSGIVQHTSAVRENPLRAELDYLVHARNMLGIQLQALFETRAYLASEYNGGGLAFNSKAFNSKGGMGDFSFEEFKLSVSRVAVRRDRDSSAASSPSFENLAGTSLPANSPVLWQVVVGLEFLGEDVFNFRQYERAPMSVDPPTTEPVAGILARHQPRCLRKHHILLEETAGKNAIFKAKKAKAEQAEQDRLAAVEKRAADREALFREGAQSVSVSLDDLFHPSCQHFFHTKRRMAKEAEQTELTRDEELLARLTAKRERRACNFDSKKYSLAALSDVLEEEEREEATTNTKSEKTRCYQPKTETEQERRAELASKAASEANSSKKTLLQALYRELLATSATGKFGKSGKSGSSGGHGFAFPTLRELSNDNDGQGDIFGGDLERLVYGGPKAWALPGATISAGGLGNSNFKLRGTGTRMAANNNSDAGPNMNIPKEAFLNAAAALMLPPMPRDTRTGGVPSLFSGVPLYYYRDGGAGAGPEPCVVRSSLKTKTTEEGEVQHLQTGLLPFVEALDVNQRVLHAYSNNNDFACQH